MTEAEKERAAVVKWLTERHDYFMLRAGWVRVCGNLIYVAPLGAIDSHEADNWVREANAFFNARSAIASGAHLREDPSNG